MAYVICVKLFEIKGLRKELKIFTQSLGRFGSPKAIAITTSTLIIYGLRYQDNNTGFSCNSPPHPPIVQRLRLLCGERVQPAHRSKAFVPSVLHI